VTHADPRLLLTYRNLKSAFAPRRPLGARLAAMLARIAEADRRHRDMQRLSELPDYVLRDIGLTRYDVARMARRSRPD
jgi:uncharacterized protein YjiS (DUF1127 family)